MADEKTLYYKKGRRQEFTLSGTSKGERVESVIGLLILITFITYFLAKQCYFGKS